jgi:hypothetical protein
MKLEKSQACPWSNLGPRTCCSLRMQLQGARRAQGRGVARADRWPAIWQPGPETSGCQGTGPRLDPRQPRVGASLGFFSLWSPERPPYGRSRGSARKINLAGELRPLSCYAFAKRWLLPQYCIMNFQPCLDHIILNYRYLSNPDPKGNSK